VNRNANKPTKHGPDHLPGGQDPIVGLYDNVVFFDKETQPATFLLAQLSGNGDGTYGIKFTSVDPILLEQQDISGGALLSLSDAAAFLQGATVKLQGSTTTAIYDSTNSHPVVEVLADNTVKIWQFIASTWTNVWRFDPDGTVHGLAAVGSISWDL